MGLYIKEVGDKGRGVFSDRPIAKGEMVEMAPAIILPQEQEKNLEKTVLSHYYLNWNGKDIAIGGGLVSFYNHSDEPNAEYLLLASETSIIINAIKDIGAHQEICTDYKNKKKFNFKRTT